MAAARRKPLSLLTLTPEDQRDKHLMIDRVAAQVTELGAEDVIVACELWEAPAVPPDDPRAAMRPQERDDHGESFVTCLLRRHGEPRMWRSPIIRAEGVLTLGDTEGLAGDAPGFLAPIIDAWSQWP